VRSKCNNPLPSCSRTTRPNKWRKTGYGRTKAKQEPGVRLKRLGAGLERIDINKRVYIKRVVCRSCCIRPNQPGTPYIPRCFTRHVQTVILMLNLLARRGAVVERVLPGGKSHRIAFFALQCCRAILITTIMHEGPRNAFSLDRPMRTSRKRQAWPKKENEKAKNTLAFWNANRVPVCRLPITTRLVATGQIA
jgi:hypothetical protein